jgi:hypothetical protein
MKNITVIIPVFELGKGDRKDMLSKAVESAGDTQVIVIGAAEDIKIVDELNLKVKTIVNDTNNTSYQRQVNLALKNVKTEYFSVLEYDDAFTPIWFKNVERYIEKDTEETFAFLPLTEVLDVNLGIVGYANEAVWASSFTNEIGYYDIQALEDYLNFNVSGAVFKTEEFLHLGGLKESIRLSFWYEFLLRALYKGKKAYVIPKIGYIHTVGREDSLTTFTMNNMSEKEANWWIDLAKKEYFFPHDRNKTYQEE